MKKSKAQIRKEAVASERWLLLSVVAVSMMMVSLALILKSGDSPRQKAEKEMETLADDYYISYLYPRLLGNLDNNPKEVLSKYNDVGVPVTYLRQLLHYNDDEHIELAETFEAIECDTNATGVKYFPVEPYGPRDYEVTYTWSCKQEQEAREKAEKKDTGRVEKIEKDESKTEPEE